MRFTYKKDMVQSAENVINSIGLSRIKDKKTTAVVHSKQVKTAALGAFLSFLILIAFSVLLNQIASDQINEFLKSEGINSYSLDSVFEELENETDVTKPDPFIGASDYVLLSNMVDSKVSASVEGSSGFEDDEFDVGMNIKTATGTFILLIVPFLALFAGGLFYAKKNAADTISQRLKAAAILGAVYGLLLALATLFSGFSYDAKIDEEFAKIAIEIDNNYSFLGALVNGFVLGTLFAGLGALVQPGSFKSFGNLSHSYRYGESIHQGIGTFFRGVVIMGVVALIAALVKTDDLENIQWGILIVFCAQAGLYMWNLLNFPSLLLQVSGDGEEFSMNYSLLGGLDEKASGSPAINIIQSFFDEVINIETVLYPSIVILVVLFIYAGYRIALQSGMNMRNILIFSFTYSLLLSFFVAITKIGAAVSADAEFDMGKMELFIGFNIIPAFVFSFILATVLAYAGGYLARLKQT
ncbi:hypothetical protein QUF49_02500 [Fictibacillus sp. b24]|uniref:hypothetical protein n=1 Tax=Fictibacillus sp. b24 TaxID=3055863 RepID=UPI0025A22935|nr:hypothetical protein [Fictibacillus sp. b24]MDM5314845.1 hypothetical protein [Fictibacillus sp. b24]